MRASKLQAKDAAVLNAIASNLTRAIASPDPAFYPSLNDLVDFTDVTAIDLTAEDLQSFGKAPVEAFPGRASAERWLGLADAGDEPPSPSANA